MVKTSFCLWNINIPRWGSSTNSSPSVRDREKWWCAVCQMSSHPDTVCIATQLDRAPDGLVVVFYAGFTANIYSAYNLRLLFDRIGGNARRCVLRFNGLINLRPLFFCLWTHYGLFPLDIHTRRLKSEFALPKFLWLLQSECHYH